MLTIGTTIGAALAWLALLFAVALLAERRSGLLAGHWKHIYALSLAVHCTSWAFYGTVTQAARHGWPVPPTFVGAIVVYVLGIAFLGKLVRLAREHHSTSIADFIATRLGRDAWLAAVVTLVAALGLIPYIALQLQAITMSFSTLTTGTSHAAVATPPPLWRDGALYLALAMALFTMLFGTRRASVAEHNRALVLAIAFESVFKLLAFLAVGALVWWGLGGSLPLVSAAAAPGGNAASDFIPLALLGGMTIFIMPHQFHISVVECRDAADLNTARWQFPLYLLLISLPTLPLALVGKTLLGQSVPSDMYVLAIPLALGQPGAALLGFLGGLSAATGMVIVSTLTLSLMIGNHWFAPGLLRGAWSRGTETDHRAGLLRLRRIGIALVMLLGWAYSRMVGGSAALADIGAVSFSALATLVPAMVFALWFPQTPPRAVLSGVVAGFAVWLWAMLLPTLAGSSAWEPAWLVEGPLGLHWLAPDRLFGLTGWSRLGRAVVASLFVGAAVTVLLTGWRGRAQHAPLPGANLATLRRAGRRFLPAQQVDDLLQGAPAHGAVPALIEQRLEHELSAVLGSASARLLLDAARRQAGPDLDTVAAIVRETSEDVRFNQRLLQAALENMSQGISVVDAELNLVAWNRRYAQVFGYPPQLLRIGLPVAALIRHNLDHGLLGTVAVETEINRRLAHMRAGTPYLSERRFPDGSMVEIRGNPMPGGGFVATFTDVTGFRATEAALKRSNETLEQRVLDRTARLDEARREAEHANAAKSRFLTAVGHDLLQPLHAAQLFADALQRQCVDAPLLEPLRGALDSTRDLLGSLLDMSRLDAGGLIPEPRALPLADVLDALAAQSAALAQARGLAFHYRPSRVWIHTDPALLRRVVQNFLANAVRYTQRGGVLLGVRRAGGRVRIEVHDTGPGIAPEEQRRMFEEFRRGEDAPGNGLGLGLSIAERIGALLDAPLALRSTPGRGTVFAVTVMAATPPAPAASVLVAAPSMPGARILAVDNDPQALTALASLLRSWGHEVMEAVDEAAAIAALATARADIWLLDYHLGGGLTGIILHARLGDRFGTAPALILSADAGAPVRRAVLESGLALLPKPVRTLALQSALGRMLAAAATGAPFRPPPPLTPPPAAPDPSIPVPAG